MDGEKVLTFLQTQGVNLLRGLITLVVGFFLIHWIMKLVLRSDKYVHIEPTLKGFLINLFKLMLYIIVILTAANVIGIPMTSVVTLLASAGVAVSLAMQGALSNLVGGLILLILHPIRAGEYVKVGEYQGTVRTVGAFYTEISTLDNCQIVLPNSTLTNTAITNYSRLGSRRMEAFYCVSYDSDMDQVYRVLRAMIEKTPGYVPEPASEVRLNKCGDSSLEFVAHVWIQGSYYWDAYYYLADAGKRALDRAGIQIPYPQVDVHIKQEEKA